MKNLHFILGNQLFPVNYLNLNKKEDIIFMAEDYELCTHYKYHKHKIVFFLSAMRSYKDELLKKNYNVNYIHSHENDFYLPYTEKLSKCIEKNKIKTVSSFEIEDKFFEMVLTEFFKKKNIEWTILDSPMFLYRRSEFQKFIHKNKPKMSVFYTLIRKKLNLLIDEKGKPIGGKWSFDKDNRKKLPKTIKLPKYPKVIITKNTQAIISFVDEVFKEHIGDNENFWYATTRNEALKILDHFIDKKLSLFGDYEDSVDERDRIIFHSCLSPYLNVGLITPRCILNRIHTKTVTDNIPLNSLEGFTRQIIGWREFMRGIYQNHEERLVSGNFFNHERSMRSEWYKGETGIPPLDYAIKNAINYSWSHHIERLMILCNIMNLCEIKPKEIYNWFMEVFTDSSDWVMSPNVYGMGLFSDGGIFSTKPYICGSSYYLKMMSFKKGTWCDVVDGLYWRFINKNRKFFLSNPRLSMMVRIFDKIQGDRKKRIIEAAEKFIDKYTTV